MTLNLSRRTDSSPFTPSVIVPTKASERSTDVTIDEHARGEKVEEDPRGMAQSGGADA